MNDLYVLFVLAMLAMGVHLTVDKTKRPKVSSISKELSIVWFVVLASLIVINYIGANF